MGMQGLIAAPKLPKSQAMAPLVLKQLYNNTRLSLAQLSRHSATCLDAVIVLAWEAGCKASRQYISLETLQVHIS